MQDAHYIESAREQLLILYRVIIYIVVIYRMLII